MKQAVLAVSSMCMAAALCMQLMGESRFLASVRLVLGLELVLVAIGLLYKFLVAVN